MDNQETKTQDAKVKEQDLYLAMTLCLKDINLIAPLFKSIDEIPSETLQYIVSSSIPSVFGITTAFKESNDILLSENYWSDLAYKSASLLAMLVNILHLEQLIRDDTEADRIEIGLKYDYVLSYHSSPLAKSLTDGLANSKTPAEWNDFCEKIFEDLDAVPGVDVHRVTPSELDEFKSSLKETKPSLKETKH